MGCESGTAPDGYLVRHRTRGPLRTARPRRRRLGPMDAESPGIGWRGGDQMERFASPQDVLEWLQVYSASAALGAALELGLPWLLAGGPWDTAGDARALGIPIGRRRWWLAQLEHSGP